MKILSIGNSFSEDAHAFIHAACQSVGIDAYCVNACIPGCTLEMHWNSFKNCEKNYLYQENGITTGENAVLREILTSQEWDIITLQQVSHFSGKYETYQPFLDDLYREIKLLCPNAKFYMHKTWAYESDFVSPNFQNYDNNQKYMYGCLCAANEKAANAIKADIIPSGDVIQYLRENTNEFNYADGGLSLNRDGFHLTLDYGRYAATLVWVCKLFDVDAFSVKYAPDNCADNLVNLIKKAVNAVLKGE